MKSVTKQTTFKAGLITDKTLLANGVSAMNLLSSQIASADYLLPFGQSFDTPDHKLVCESLIAHRLVSKWHVPNKQRDNVLRDECYASWRAHEDKISGFSFPEISRCDSWTPHGRSALKPDHTKAIALMRNWLRPFNYQLRAWATYDTSCESLSDVLGLDFTPGETYTSSGGFTSVKQKLMSSSWTLTSNLIDWACTVILNHKSLRECALARIWQVRTTDAWTMRVDLAMFESRISYDDWIALNCIKFLFTIVDGARASSVAKNNQKRRFINIEPLFNMIYQRGVGLIIRKALKLANNDLEIGQHAHREYIRSMLYSTFDLRNASDSNIYVAARTLLSSASPDLWSAIDCSRSPTTTFFETSKRDGRIVTTERIEVNCKLSSMGNGFTFEVMTLLLLAQARIFDPHARVYGDDIIISHFGPHGLDAGTMFIDLIKTTGWEINVDKSFHDSQFYESCGGFVHQGVELVSFDFNPIECLADLIITCNKLRKCIDALDESSRIRPYFVEAHKTICDACPSLIKGPIRTLGTPGFNKGVTYSEVGVNADYIEHENYLRSHRKQEASRERYSKLLPLLHFSKLHGVISSVNCVVVKVPRFVNKLASVVTRDVQCPFTKAHYFYANGVSKDNIRGEGAWRTVTCLTFSDGHVIPVAFLKKVRRDTIISRQPGPKPYSYSTVYNDERSLERAQWHCSSYEFGYLPGTT